ncbi:recombinase family protein [Thermoanaerobacter thermohydrosulfuricus]|uniref:recombinase family protein n=1 Tax=Thermoanaerobacter thermohydrosulfuricus TaxID=1516 RepID=UPI0009E9D8C8|nr:recombinase family protein [Thermoanaerobacter thermohydrosulfuricus]
MKAAAYARYSSDNQREESIEAQLRAIKEYCVKNNIQLVKIYTDEAKSATTDNRPAFLQMIQDSALGLFSAVIVHKLDRFSRDRYDSAFYKRQLKKNGVRLISVLENLDDSPESIILESVLEGMAEYYSRNLAREIMKGMKETALQCKHTGGIPPLGYDVGLDKTYIINEHEARAVRMIFEMYAAGKGYSDIIRAMNDSGFRTKTGRHFGKNSIHEILRNEKYRGIYIYNRTASKEAGKRNHHKSKSEDEIIRIEGGIPRIIDDETWERVQERMKRNKKGVNSAKETYLLSGLIYCGKCGGAMTGNRRHSGTTKNLYVNYECSTRKRTKACNMKSISKDYVENIVIEHLEKNVFSPEAIEKLVKKISEYAASRNVEINRDIKLFTDQLAGVQTEINNIVNAIAAGMFHPSMKEKMDELETKKANLTIKLEEAKLQAQTHAPTEDMIRKYLQKDADIRNKSPEEQKRIIQTYVKKIIVYDDKVDIDTIVTFDGGADGT